jgi:Protein of unknown function (DUF2911)
MSHHACIRTLAVGVFLVAVGARISSEQVSKPAATTPDGLLRSELSLVGRTASVSVTPALRASDPAHQSLFAAAGADGGRVRIGQLRTTGTLQFGTISVGKIDPAGVRYDLWLQSTRDGWQLEIVEPSAQTGTETASAPAKISLARHPSPVAFPTLIAALLPASRDTGRLVLKWGEFTADTELQFTEPTNRRPTGTGRPNEPISRTHDEDNRTARLTMLAQLNETAMVLPNGSRFSISFARSFPKGTRRVSAAGTLGRGGLGVDGPDFARLMSTADGAVVQLTEAPVPRLAIEAPLRIGNVLLRAGNQATGYPGAYGLWLKRAGRGWRLVFSNEPDTWGTQHDPRFDAAEIDVSHSEGGEPSRPFAIALEPTAADRGRLLIQWGPHEWIADFVAAD